MKKFFGLFIFAVALLAFVGNISAEIMEKDMKNCGPDGCRTVNQVSNKPLIGQNKHTLTCRDSGATECKWDITMMKHAPYLQGYAEHQIDIGNFHGTFSATVNGVPCEVTWNAVSATEYIITEADHDDPLQ